MRKVAFAMILMATFGMGVPFALAGGWWWVLVCIIAAMLWLWPSKFAAHRRPTISFLILAGVGGAGALIGHPPVWQLTSFVALLMAWDLDHYQRTYRAFADHLVHKNQINPLFYAHLKRLGIIAGLGWCLGMVALHIRIQINFALALLFAFLIILGLRELVQYLVQLRFSQND